MLFELPSATSLSESKLDRVNPSCDHIVAVFAQQLLSEHPHLRSVAIATLRTVLEAHRLAQSPPYHQETIVDTQQVKVAKNNFID